MSYMAQDDDDKLVVDQHENVISSTDEKGQPLCESVQNLANDIYKEFEFLIKQYGNDFIHNLMPLVVNALESLDGLHSENADLQLKLALIKEDHRLLTFEYEKEKRSRKISENKLFRAEDELEEERKQYEQKIANVEANNNILDVKNKNLMDQVSRCEEHELELKKDYQRLHDLYTNLLRAYLEYVERVRTVLHRNKIDPHLNDLGIDSLNHCVDFVSQSAMPQGMMELNSPNLTRRDLFDLKTLESERQRIMRLILETTPELYNMPTVLNNSGLSEPCFDELSQTDLPDDEEHEIRSHDGSLGTPQPNLSEASGNEMFSGVRREVQNLIKENQELIQTKNALNVVTNDLIGRIDELSCQNRQLSSDLNSLITNRASMLLRIKDLEQENAQLRKEFGASDCLDDYLNGSDYNSEDLPLSMRAHFSRVEMARVLLERNQYKEQLVELQEAVRWAETLRAKHRRSTSIREGLRSFFSNLFNSSNSLSSSKKIASTRNPHVARSVSHDNRSHYNSNNHNGYNANSQRRSMLMIVPGQFNQSVSFGIAEDYSPSPPQTAHCPTPNMEAEYKVNEDWLPFMSRRNIAMGIPDVSCVHQLQDCPPTMEFRCASLAYRTIIDNPLFNQFEQFPLSAPSPCFSIGGGCGQLFSSPSPYTTQGTDLRQIKRQQQYRTYESELSNVVWLCSYCTKQDVTVPKDANLHRSPDTSLIKSLINIVSLDNPVHTVDSFAVCSSIVLCMCAMPEANPNDCAQLEITKSYWNAIPMESCVDDLFLYNQKLDSTGPSAKVKIGENSIQADDYCPIDSSSHLMKNPHDAPVASTSTAYSRTKPNSRDCCNGSSGNGGGGVFGCTPSSSSQNKRLINALSSTSNHSSGNNTNNNVDEVTMSYIVIRRRFLIRQTEDVESSAKMIPSTVSAHEPSVMNDCPISTSSPSHNQDQAINYDPQNYDPFRSSFADNQTGATVSTANPTMWLGCQNGDLYVHSTVGCCRRSLAAIRLPDSITEICHLFGRAFVSLANGQIVVFRRRLQLYNQENSPNSPSSLKTNVVTSSNLPDNQQQDFVNGTETTTTIAVDDNDSDELEGHTVESPHMSTSVHSANATMLDTSVGAWDFMEACVISCGRPQCSVRATIAVPPTKTIWASYRNRVLVINAITLQLSDCFKVHAIQDAQIQSMSFFKDGVWISVRRESIVRLYHVITHELMQSVDLWQLCSSMITSSHFSACESFTNKLNSPGSFIITSMKSVTDRLWLGTNKGFIFTIPFRSPQLVPISRSVELIHQNYDEADSCKAYVDMSLAQISALQHLGPINVFVSLYQSPTSTNSFPKTSSSSYCPSSCNYPPPPPPSSSSSSSVLHTSTPIRPTAELLMNPGNEQQQQQQSQKTNVRDNDGSVIQGQTINKHTFMNPSKLSSSMIMSAGFGSVSNISGKYGNCRNANCLIVWKL